MGKLSDEKNRVSFPRFYGKRDNDGSVIVTFTYTQSVEFDAAEIVGLSDGAIIERARELVASQYDGHLVDGADLLLSDADVDLENMRGAL